MNNLKLEEIMPNSEDNLPQNPTSGAVLKMQNIL